MAVVKTTDKDLGLKKIIKELKKLESKPFIKVGWPSESSKSTNEHKNAEGFTVVMIAIVHEFGAPSAGIPERSMIRAAHDEFTNEWNKATAILVAKIYMGRTTVENALDILGLLLVKDIKKRMVEGIPPQLAIREGTALIDTAQMLNALTFKRIMK